MRTLLICVVLLCAGDAAATSYGPPEPHDIYSPDRAFVLHVDPKADRLTVARSGEPTTPLWSLERRITFEEFFLANGGETIAVVSWRFVKVDELDRPGLELIGRNGRIAAYSVDDMIAQPPPVRGVGPIGSFWRDWLDDVSLDGDRLTIATTGLFSYVFDLKSGTRTSKLRWAALPRLGGALALLGLAVVVIAWTRRSRRDVSFPSDRRRFVVAVLALVVGLVWAALELAGLPLVPAEIVGLLRELIWIVAVLLVPVSLLAIAKLPPGTRRVRLLLTLLVVPGVVLLRFLM